MDGLGVSTKNGVVSITREEAELFGDPYLIKFIEFGQLSLQDQYDRFMDYLKNNLDFKMIKCTNIYSKAYQTQYPITMSFLDLLCERGFTLVGNKPETLDVFGNVYLTGFMYITNRDKKITFRSKS